eukprot:GFYU01006483.1.p1 GENE.GFYU01006483.1~~GFYU01006483.1.p1  ORF type:complete len:267 (+),score=69.02 GFYU01006483.1:68-802(+)
MAPKFVENFYATYVDWLCDFLPFGVPGTKYIPMRYVINFQKAGTAIACLLLMFWFDNWNLGAYTYLTLHGTYGIVWLMKDMIHPDPNWEHPVGVLGAINTFMAVLGPYWYAMYHTISSGVDVTPQRMSVATSLCILGCVAMMASDTQKYFVLKIRRGLIADGWFKRCRNTNYLAEMMVYSSFAIVAQSTIAWCILFYVWGLVFFRNMFKKEFSLRKKEGWAEYRQHSGFLLPYFGPINDGKKGN